MSTSTAARRAAPALAAVTVLLLVLGVVAVLRSSGGGAGRPDSGDRAGSSGDAAPLALTDYRLPAAGSPVEPRFRLAGGLPGDVPDPVSVRWLGAPDAAARGRLALALGLPPTGRTAGGATTYGAGVARLTVQDGPGGQWQYAGGNALECPRYPTADQAPSSEGGPGALTVCAGPPTPSQSDPAPSATAPAETTVAVRVLKAVGIGARGTVVRRVSPTVASVLGQPTVAGLPTSGMTSVVRLIGDRVLDAGGWLPASRAGAAYSVVSARTAWDRLRRTPLPQTLIGCTEPLPPGADPLSCGGPLTVTGARLGLSLRHVGDRPVLVPAWLFRVKGSDELLPVVAVPRRLLRVPPPSASAGPTSAPVAPPTVRRGPGKDPVSPEPAHPGSRFSAVHRTGPRALSVTFTGGVAACWSYRVAASETGAAVRLALTETGSANKRCIELAQVYQRTVRLGAALGGRPVLDAASGAVLLAGSR